MRTVTLDQPIARGETTIATVDVRPYHAGDMRGLKLLDIASGAVDAMRVLLPRITIPPVTAAEIDGLSQADFFALSSEAINFLEQKGPQGLSPTA